MRDFPLLAALLLAAPVAAQTVPPVPPVPPSVPVLAQALDRCMATYAVRLTRTDAADEAIFAAAQTG